MTTDIIIYRWASRGDCIRDIQLDCEMIRTRGWILADKVISAVAQFAGGGRAAITELYDDIEMHTGLKRQTLHNMVSTARKFPPSRRNESLTVSHHMALLGVEDDMAASLLDDAEAQNMSVRNLRRVAHGSMNGNGFPTVESSENGQRGHTTPDADAGNAIVNDAYYDESDGVEQGRWMYCPHCGARIG